VRRSRSLSQSRKIQIQIGRLRLIDLRISKSCLAKGGVGRPIWRGNLLILMRNLRRVRRNRNLRRRIRQSQVNLLNQRKPQRKRGGVGDQSHKRLMFQRAKIKSEISKNRKKKYHLRRRKHHLRKRLRFSRSQRKISVNVIKHPSQSRFLKRG